MSSPACLEDQARDQAEAEVAGLFPVLFAVWDSTESGMASPAYLAAQLGITERRVRLLAVVADWLIDQEERGLAIVLEPEVQL